MTPVSVSDTQTPEVELQRNTRRVEIDEAKRRLERYLGQLGALCNELAAEDADAPRFNRQTTTQLTELADALGETRSVQVLYPLRAVIASWRHRTGNVRTREILGRVQAWVSHTAQSDEALRVQLGYLPPQLVQVRS